MLMGQLLTLKAISQCSSLSCTRHAQTIPLQAVNATGTCRAPIRRHGLNSNTFHNLGKQQRTSRNGVTHAAGRLQGSETAEASILPNSREEAIEQACSAIAANLPSVKSQKNKKRTAAASAPGFSGETKKLSVEIPVADESLDAAMQLAKDVISGLPSPWPTQFTYIVSTSNINSPNVVSLDACLRDESDSLLASCIILIAPKTNDVAAVEQLLGRWRGSVCILLNAEFSPLAAEEDLGGIDSVHTAFVRSFQAVYCFMPLLIKAFVVSTQEGAVFRCVGDASKKKSGFTSGDGEGQENPWRIFMNKNNSMEPVARMQRRPSSTEIEVSFYNASAASSPLTQGAKFLKGLVNKKK